MSPPPDSEHLLRELTPQVLGTLVRRYRDFAAAEDAMQEALLAAATQWPHDGVPENPRAWLTQVASRRLTDQIRSDSARRRRESTAAMESGYIIPAPALDEQDDTLTLMSMCCHSALSMSSAIALTLRAVGGLTTAEIARAFLVPESTMAQRISRAKQTIKESGTPFQPAESYDAILHVLYLVFNEGYASSSGEHFQRTDLATEAIRLTRAVYALLPKDTEVAGLLTLLLLTDARRAARTGPLGEIIPLDKQDRGLWDRAQIEEGVALLSSTLAKGSVGPYQLQAAIAAVHDEAASVAETDWPQILALYELLQRMSNNPMVTLNRAVATAMVHGPMAGLALLDELDATGALREHHRLSAVRGHLLEMSGDFEHARASYQQAATQTASLPERNYLLSQVSRMREATIRVAKSESEFAIARELFQEYASALGLDLSFQNFAAELDPQGCLLLAFQAGNPVGCIGLRRRSPDECEIKRLYVRPTARGSGLGRQLVLEVLDRARAAGYRRAVLDTLSSMRAAEKLYRSLGFQETVPYYNNPLPNALYFALDLAVRQ